MAAPSIALRFRDVVPNLDTVGEHRAIISAKGKVWWGWWKKEFEESHKDRIENTIFPCDIFIVDRSTSRAFVARAVDFKAEEMNEAEMDLVPSYYKDSSKRVFLWFLLTSIKEIDYTPDISLGFGDNTISFIGVLRNQDKIFCINGQGRNSIMHLSDLHFGEYYEFRRQAQLNEIGSVKKTLTECVIYDLKRIGLERDIAAVIVTGDFTTGGAWGGAVRQDILAEFDALREALNLSQEQVIAVPGNHDVERYPPGSGVDPAALSVKNQTNADHEREFRYFVEELTGRSRKDPLNYVANLRLNHVDVNLCVLNSCSIVATEWTEYGFVGDSGIDAIMSLSAGEVDRPTYRIMALHHHLLPVSDVAAPNSKGVTLSLDAPKLLDAAQSASVQIILHGHEHMPRLVKYQTIPFSGSAKADPLLIVSNGSSGARHDRRPGSERNTYCLFKMNEHEACLWVRELRSDGRLGHQLYEGELGISPMQPMKV